MFKHCDWLIPNLNIPTNGGSTGSTSELEQEEGEIFGKNNGRIRYAKSTTGEEECSIRFKGGIQEDAYTADIIFPCKDDN
jgi:hypothetical protein